MDYTEVTADDNIKRLQRNIEARSGIHTAEIKDLRERVEILERNMGWISDLRERLREMVK